MWRHGWFHSAVTERLEDAVGGRARLQAIVLLAGVLGLSTADSGTVGAVAAPLEAGLHIGNTQLGLLATASTAVGAVATLPAGAAVDRVRRVRLLSAAILVWSAAMIVSAFAVSYPMLLLTRVALGAVIATAGPAVASLTGDLFMPGERAQIYGYILTGELVGAGIGVLVSGDMAEVFSWRVSFGWLAVPGVILAWLLARLIPEPDRGGQSRLQPAEPSDSASDRASGQRGDASGTGEQQPPDDTSPPRLDEPVSKQVRRFHVEPHSALVLHADPERLRLAGAVRYVLSIRTNVVLIIASALGYFYFAGLRTFAVECARGRFGLSQAVASSLMVLVGGGAVLGVLLGGRVADRLIRRGVLTARPAVAGAAFLLAVVAFLPGLLIPGLLIALPLLVLGAAFYSASNPPLDAARLDVVHHRLWGRAEAVRTVLRAVPEAGAPLLFGYVSSLFAGGAGGRGASTANEPVTAAVAHGLDLTFLIMLAPLVVSGVLLLTVGRASYPRDVATTIASEHATRPGAARGG